MKTNNKTTKTLAIVFGAIIILGTAIYFLGDLVVEPYLKKKVRQGLNKSGVEYNVTFEDLDVQIFGSSIYLNGIVIEPAKEPTQLSSSAFKLIGTNISIKNISIFKFIFSNELEISDVQADSLAIKFFSSSDTTQTDPGSSASKNNLKALIVENIAIDNGYIEMMNVTSGTVNTLGYFDLDLVVKNLQFFPSNSLDSTLKYDAVDGLLTSLHYNTTDSLREISADTILISTEDSLSNIEIQNVNLRTTYEKYELAEALGFSIDWMEMDIPNILVNKIDLTKALFGNSLIANEIRIKNPEISVFKDRRYPLPEQRPKLIFEFLKSVRLNVDIDSITSSNGIITYQEHVESMDDPGYVTFANLDVEIANVNNYFDDPQVDTMYIAASASVMGAARLNAYWKIPLSPDGITYVSGELEPMDLTAFNPMISQVGYAIIESGRSHGIEFNISLNDQQSSGNVWFRYENLHIETISKSTGSSEGLIPGIKTLFANMVIDDENMGDDIRVGDVSFSRDMQKSMFNYWWKSLLSGLQDSINLPG